MNSHFHFLIIVEMVDAPVMLQWPKHRRTTWGVVRTLGRMVLYSRVSDGLGHPLKSWTSNQPPWNSEQYFLSNTAPSLCHKHKPISAGGKFWLEGNIFYLQLQARKPYLLNIPHISVFQAETIQSIPETFPGEIQELSDNHNQKLSET